MNLFTRKQQLFGNAVAIICLIFGLLQIFLSWKLDPAFELYLNYISYLIFGRAVHIGLTIAMLISVPELRTWYSEQQTVSPTPVLRKWLLIFIFFVVCQISYARYYGSKENNLWQILLVLFWLFFPTYHTFRQTYGIVILHNFEKTPVTQLNSERNLFAFLTGIIFLAGAAFVLKLNRWISVSSYERMTLFCFIVFIVALVWLLIKNISNSQKALFLLRVFLYPLSFYSPIAFIGNGAIHGMEYYFITNRIITKAKSKKGIVNQAWATVFILFVMGLYLLNSRFGLWALLTKNVGSENILANTILIVSGALGAMHYYLDGIIFRMKDPISRKIIGPLLK